MIDNTAVEDNGSTPDSKITADKALNLALEKAEVKMADLTSCDIKYHNKKEGPEYKIHFHVDKDHYEYIVNAVTGEVTEKKAPHETEEKPTPEKPVAPHEKDKEESKVTITMEDEDKDVTLVTPEPAKKEEPLKPHEKAEAEKPAGPKEKAAGPKDAKVTVSLEK